MSIQLIIVCVYIALLFGISFYVKRRADKGSTEYLFAGRKLSAGLIAVNITGLAVGAASTVGVAENAFKVGMAAGWYNAAWAVLLLLCLLLRRCSIWRAGRFWLRCCLTFSVLKAA